MQNSQTKVEERYRSAVPINSVTCRCWDFWGAFCVAWCTNVPVNNFEIVTASGSGQTVAACPAGKLVLGCHLDPTGIFVDDWRYWYPSSDGTSCNCKDNFSHNCVASCASNINSYEVVSKWGTGNVTVSCTKPNNQVLGCGHNPNGASKKENYRVDYAQYNSCVCYDYFGTQCYAICGQIW